ncbi:hypothetical protein BJX66DRAFT_343896 [Aspergillus keveii]|uniref:Methyltransferase type 11 domain-containing protein n=1 Tax=Aspergillus keveii TaxID=714993 RepID=A0ABR4FMY8_9EURO
MSYPFLNLHPTTPLLYNSSPVGNPPFKKTTVGKSDSVNGVPPSAESTLTLYPYTESKGTISDYAPGIVTPFDKGFVLDPIKLGAATPFLSPVLRVPAPIRHREFRVLDLGSTRGGSEPQDTYPGILNRIQNVRAVRVSPSGMVPGAVDYGRDFNSNTQEIIREKQAIAIQSHTSASLPMASGSVDMVIARGLHKDTIGVTKADSVSGIEASLAEFFRILRHGGILEYIFFERRLTNAGPLAQKLEEAWNADVNGIVSISQFMAAIDKVGLTGGQHLRTTFGLVTLNRLFDGCGRRRGQGIRAELVKVSLRMGDTSSQGLEVLRELQNECEKLGTGWRCVIGWCTKP